MSGIKILKRESLIYLIGFLIFITSLSCVCWGQSPTPADVSSYVIVTTANERSTLDRRTRQITSTADVTIMNKVDPGKIISSPLHAVISINNADGQVTMPEATGTYPDGRFYYDLSSRLTNNQLPPGSSVTFIIKFVRASSVRFTYSVSTFGVLPSENQAPTANAGPDQTMTLQIGQTSIDVQLSGSGTDPDGTITGYTWTGTPDPDDVQNPSVSLGAGTYTFTLVVTDNNGASSTPASVTVTVSPPPNQPPTANAGPDQTLTLPSGQSTMNVQLNGSGIDPDGTITGYTWTGTPDPADVATPTVSLTAGTYTFTLVVTDDKGTPSSGDDVVITVGQAIPPQVLLNPLTYTVAQGLPLTFSVSATHPDGKPISLSASPQITNATFSAAPGNSVTGTFNFRPDFTQLGKYLITFKARDLNGLSDSKTAEINVTKNNQPPSITGPFTASVNEGALLTIPVQASDPNGDIVTLTATGLPNNAIFIPSTGTITFTPDYTQAGLYTITITASDGQASTSLPVQVTVNDVPTGGTGTGELVLNVDPVESPTFLMTQRITGTVNRPSGPTAQPLKSVLITEMSPATGEQGATLNVNLAGDSGDYVTHFTNGVSSANFGTGITVNSTTVTSPNQAAVNITISPTASLGPRSVMVTTGSEVAVSVVAFNVIQGKARIAGTLIDPDTGLPISGASVNIQGTNITAITNPDGSFTLLDVSAGQYALIVNAPNHELITLTVNAPTGQTLNLGDLQPKSTVFDPTAPPSVSLLSVLGRGSSDPTNIKNMDSLKQVIRDAILLVGGDEAGILDEYGNQLNPDLTGYGMISLTAAGLNLMTERMARGESMSLQEILFALSFGMRWKEGQPLNLEEWLLPFQALVDQAWQDPNNPEHGLPVLIFSKTNVLLPEPPKLSPHTRLNTLQGYLLIASLLSYVEDRKLTGSVPGGTMLAMSRGNSTIASDAYPSTFGRFGLILAQTAPPPPPSSPSNGKPFTRFWRNFFTTKTNVLEMTVYGTEEYITLMSSLAVNSLIASTGGVLGALGAIINMGTMYDDFNNALINAGFAGMVPEPPVITKADLIKQPDDSQSVKVSFKPSPNDTGNDPVRRFVYNLYRFQSEEIPRLVARLDRLNTEGFEFTDPSPLDGVTFYTITATRYMGYGDTLPPETQSWWAAALSGENWDYAARIFRLGRNRLTSDYSAPVSVYVGPLDFSGTLDGIEVDPDPAEDVLYYSDAGKGILYKVMEGGLGDRIFFADAGFKRSIRDGREIVQQGLAIDSQGNLYCDNAASDDQFGGRLFKFSQPDGARSFTGSLNYFSQMLMFAHPTFSGPMVIRRHPDPSQEDLFVVDNLTMTILAVPVNQPWDPYRRVGQPYATISPEDGGGVSRVIDMQFDEFEDLHVLEGWRVLKFENGVQTTEALFTPE